MSTDVVISLATQAMNVAFKVAMPLLLAGLVVGLIVSVFQAVTQIQEQTLAFIPKIVAIAAVLVIGGPWMLGQVLTYTTDLYSGIPALVGR
jgi:flagellar biosynthetic protein FliQ